jgi:hypothetical protein
MNSAWRACSGVFQVSRALVLVTIPVLLAGCSDTPYDIVPIHGTVTYEDGSLIPADKVYVWFYPQVDPLNAKVQPRPGIASLNSEDGTFPLVSTSKHGDGVILGQHKVVVKVADESRTGADAIPRIYTNPATTPLQIEVTGRNQEVELKIAKPGRAAKRK